LLFLSGLFSYPETLPSAADLDRLETAWRLESTGETLRILQGEYVRLFVNSLPEVPCPPYGSFYIEGTLMGESTVALRNLYRSYGFVADEIPDHVAVELEFLALLAASSQGDPAVEKVREFLVSHLRTWMPLFLDHVEENDDTGFYKASSRYARKALPFDQATFTG
jgi:TorA maturation chaperone TorD